MCRAFQRILWVLMEIALCPAQVDLNLWYIFKVDKYVCISVLFQAATLKAFGATIFNKQVVL